MKRIIASILTLIILLQIFIPTITYAAEDLSPVYALFLDLFKNGRWLTTSFSVKECNNVGWVDGCTKNRRSY